MKTFIFALIGLLGLSVAAPYAEARDRDRDHRRYYKHRKHYYYRHYPRYYSHRYYPRYYTYPRYSYPRYYSYSDDYPYYGRYYSRRPAVTFSFGL